jgi:diguanylate cyclase (GGDEF)-like protein/PAS domain S-box-containing protein
VQHQSSEAFDEQFELPNGPSCGFDGRFPGPAARQDCDVRAAATALKLESLLEAAQDHIFSLDRDLRFTYLNGKARAYFGLAEDLVGRNVLEVLPGAGETDFAKAFLRVLREGGTEAVEAFFPPSGRWYETSATANGEGITVFFRDITRRRKIEAELQESHNRSRRELEAMLDGLPEMVWSADRDGSAGYTNERWHEFTGIPREAPDKASAFFTLIHPDDVAQFLSRWRSSQSAGSSSEIQYRLRHHSGEYRWVRGRVRPERNARGEIIRWYGTLTDVHEGVLAEQGMEQQRELLQTVIDSVSDLIFVKDRSSRFVLVNKALEEGCGIRPGSRTNKRISAGLRTRFELTDQEVISTGAKLETEDTIPIFGEDRRFETVKVPWIDRGQIAGVIGVSRDVTNRRLAEAALLESEALYRSILEASGDCIKILGVDGTLQFMNGPGACAMEIDHVDNVLGQNWPTLWPIEAQKTAKAAVEEARAGHPARFTDLCPTAKGMPKWWDVVITPMTNEAGEVTRLLAISRDITATREAADKLRWTSEHDGLTTLPNREAFQAHLQAATLRAMESGGMVGLLLMDLDHFKHVNDTLGHAAGDHLLKTFGERLKSSVRGTDLVARLGGDEFAIILEGVQAQDDLVKVGEGILKRLHAPIRYGERVLSAGASIGGAVFPNDAASAHELFKNADTALYALKNAGRGGTRMFHNYMREEAQKVASQLSLARVAISEKSVIPHYQQKIDLQTGRVRGFEALLRWNHPSQGIQSPDTVAEAFKDYELASKIGELMQTKVFSDIRSWQRAGINFGRVSINAAPAEFLRDDFAERLLVRLAEYQIAGEAIEVEVTEHVFLDRGAEYVTRALKLLNENGIRISLDDFGTGYSSLSHLRDFPVDVVKIDRSFISRMVEEPEIRAIVSAVVDLAASLSLEVVAEGIETEEQAAVLRNQGCGSGQGYLFGRAVIADEVRLLLSR